jgi:hypothetical protein
MAEEGKFGEGKQEGVGETVDITIVLQPDGFRHGISVPVTYTVENVAEDVGKDLSLDPSGMRVLYEGKEVPSGTTLTALNIQPGETDAMLEIVLPEGGAPINEMGGGEDIGNFEQKYGDDEIEVTVHFDDPDDPRHGSPVTLLVKIERENRRKLYLGGYRSRKTGIVYHHGSTQTAQVIEPETGPEKFTRESQTAIEVSRSIQTKRENGTQMDRKDLYLDNKNDREVAPKAYFSSTEWNELKVKTTIVMQCYWRGYVARCRAHALRKRQEDRRRAIEDEEERQREAARRKHEREVERRMNPRTTEDFEVLYNELENWRQHETRRINENFAGQEKERLAELAKLLHKETKLLQTIDRLKIGANKNNRGARIKKMLDLMSAPKQWQMSDGDVAEVHTPFTTRAKELMELYQGLNLPMLSIDERLDVLLHVKWTVKEFDCNLTRNIVELIDREADLLNRGRTEKSLEGLRTRLSNMFLRFIETPEFNPEAARFQKVPRDLMLRPDVRPITSGPGH